MRLFSKNYSILLLTLLVSISITHLDTLTIKNNFAQEIYVPKETKVKRIIIPSLQIDLPIKTSYVQNKEWVLGKEWAAFIGEDSAVPGEKGTTVIFAHAKEGLFAQISLLDNNQNVFVFSSNAWYRYQINQRLVVLPNDTSFIKTDGENSLALLTCFGENDEQRIVLIGKLKEVIKISEIKNLEGSI